MNTRKKAMALTRRVYPRCPPERRVSIAWPDDHHVVVRRMVNGRFQYEEFSMDDEDGIVAWACS